MIILSPMSGYAITLANSIIGVGILAMPFCFKQCGIVLSILILLGSGIVSRLACYFLMKSAVHSRRDNFESLAYYVFGSAGKFAAEIGIIGFLMGTCVAYFVVVGDLGPQIIAKMFNLNQSDFLRTCVMVIVSLVCVLPLGLLRNVDSLSNVSAATIGFYFCLVLKILVEAANPLLSGEWTSKVEYWRPEGVLQCIPIFSMALCCQTQLFEIYDNLPNATLDKMNNVIKNAVNICTVVYIFVGLFGYIAFCHLPISGNILINFSPTTGSDVIQVGFVMSLAFSFPLMIFPCRASLYSMLYRKGQAHNQDLINNLIPKLRFKCLTVGIIFVTLVIGVMLPNIELVLGLVGSTIGIMICVIFPSTCFICISVKNTNERILAQIVLCLGIVIMVLGTYANLQAVEMDKVGLETKIAIEKDKYVQLDNKLIIPKNIDNDINGNVIINELKKEKKSTAAFKNVNIKTPVVKSDSKIQPPNPVPPIEDSQVKVQPPAIQPVETPVKLKSSRASVDNKLQGSMKEDKVEGAGDKEINVQLEDILNVEPPKVVETTKRVEEKNTEKEAVLIQTIKKHAEVQRQMVEEQKEILKELKDIESKQQEESRKNQIANKKAVESIKKLAEAAIASLQEVPSQNTQTPDLKETINLIEKVVVEGIEHKPEANHGHNQPDSYKVGEDIVKEKHKIVEAKRTLKKESSHLDTPEKSSFDGGVPIAIALSKGTKSGKSENEILKDTVKSEKIKSIKHLENQIVVENIVTVQSKLSQSESPAYVGGKRDILEIQTEKTPSSLEDTQHLRHKRESTNTINQEVCTKNKLTSLDSNVGANNEILYKQFNSNSVKLHIRGLKSHKDER